MNFSIPGIEKAEIQIFPELEGTLFHLSSAEARDWGEAEVQLIEGFSYEYNLTNFLLDDANGIVRRSKLNQFQGRIQPRNYVGTLRLSVLSVEDHYICGELRLEVRSIKLSYRDHYREMLYDIAGFCNELLLQANSPIVQNIQPLFSGDSKTLYQRFSFLKSVIDNEDFSQAIHRIISSPVTNWRHEERDADSRGIKRLSRNQMRQLCSSGNRNPIPTEHPFQQIMSSLPNKISSIVKCTTVDTSENRFIKHALNTFLLICIEVCRKAVSNERLCSEALQLATKMEQFLGNQLFREIANPILIPLNSPVLQRKEGYREVLRVWMMYDLASSITWDGGEDVYSGGKKDVATLYEYWVYFKLLEMIRSVFNVKPEDVEHLLSSTLDGLNLELKRGKHLAVKGMYETQTRTLNVEFSYNRQFSSVDKYPDAGSWTKNFKPDYTLSVWPHGISQKTAEDEETIVHIHFDAKYRVKDLQEILGADEDSTATSFQVNGQDILKMHAYKDAIRRTAGAYVIYPGDEKLKKKGFHEVIPGLGAFPLKPGNRCTDKEAIMTFMKDVAKHLLDRATQSEKIALKRYEIYKDPQTKSVYAPMPVLTGNNRGLLPDETYVLVAWYKDFYHKKWIEDNGFFNVRTGLRRGSLVISPMLAGTKYLLLHSSNELESGHIYRLNGEGPVIWSKEDLEEKGYPSELGSDFYLVFRLAEKRVSMDFDAIRWDLSKLGEFTGFRGSPKPIVVSLSDLMKVRVNPKEKM